MVVCCTKTAFQYKTIGKIISRLDFTLNDSTEHTAVFPISQCLHEAKIDSLSRMSHYTNVCSGDALELSNPMSSKHFKTPTLLLYL